MLKLSISMSSQRRVLFLGQARFEFQKRVMQVNQHRNLDIESLFAVPSVSSFDLPKVGNRIVFSSNRSGQWQLYLGELSRERPLEANQFTYDSESKLEAKFTPDSNSLIYASDYRGDENFDLFFAGVRKPKPRNLTENTPFAILPHASLSNDGQKIALVSNQSGAFAVYILNIGDSSMARISNHDFSDHYATFSPDDSKVAFTSSVSGQDSGLFVTPSNGRETIRLVDQKTREFIDADEPEWSPDGKKIAFVSSSKGSYDIGLWNIATNEIEWLTDSKHEYYSPVFSHDGKKIIYSMNAEGDIKLVIHDLWTRIASTLDFRPGVVGRAKFTLDDREIVFLFTGPKNPADIWKYDFESGVFTQLTNSLPPEIDTRDFVEGTQVYYECRKDGLKIPALLFAPLRANRSIAVVEIHGGPTSQDLNTWDPIKQALVSKGIVVISPNYRGSTGYGRKFREANRFVMGDLDLADCASAWEYLVENGIADADKIAVTGASFGGYLTMCALTRYPGRWVCGSALVPFLNWFTEIRNEREDLRYWDMQNMGDPEKDAERLREASPIFYLDKVTAPVQVIAGAHDPRCPLEESEQARDELLKLGKQVEFKFYEDEGHGFRKIRNRVDAYRRSIEFLEKYLFG